MDRDAVHFVAAWMAEYVTLLLETADVVLAGLDQSAKNVRESRIQMMLQFMQMRKKIQ